MSDFEPEAVRLPLPTVTLCAASSVNLDATIAALRASLDQVDFAECLLFTDAALADIHPSIRVTPVERIASSERYSDFILTELAEHVRTDHCLIVQWDGFVLDARQWEPGFLNFDYIGAPWPQFSDGHDVGNGGFSLRSSRLLEACRDPRFHRTHPEDLAIGRDNRLFLEREHGIRFADRETASRFAFERTTPSAPTFGFHGIFNMIPALGPDRFWELYESLDDRRTAFTDYRLLMGQLGRGGQASSRRARLTAHRLAGLLRA